jgi:hypothetical protein
MLRRFMYLPGEQCYLKRALTECRVQPLVHDIIAMNVAANTQAKLLDCSPETVAKTVSDSDSKAVSLCMAAENGETNWSSITTAASKAKELPLMAYVRLTAHSQAYNGSA